MVCPHMPATLPANTHCINNRPSHPGRSHPVHVLSPRQHFFFSGRETKKKLSSALPAIFSGKTGRDGSGRDGMARAATLLNLNVSEARCGAHKGLIAVSALIRRAAKRKPVPGTYSLWLCDSRCCTTRIAIGSLSSTTRTLPYGRTTVHGVPAPPRRSSCVELC